MERNARFWTWHVGAGDGGWVKLTLRPGQSITLMQGGTTEEGWWRQVTTWTHEGDGVLCECLTDGRDCDGRTEHDSESWAALDQLAAVPMDSDRDWTAPACNAGIKAPQWVEGKRSQRDYTAEAMGY